VSKILVKQQTTLQDFGLEPLDEFPTIPYDPSQLTPGIEASLKVQSDSYRNTPMGEGYNTSNIQPKNLQEYRDMLLDDYYRNVSAYTNPSELESIETDLENARNTAMRQVSNQVGGYGPKRIFQLFPKDKTPQLQNHPRTKTLPLDLDEDGNLAYLKDLEKLNSINTEQGSIKNTLPGTYDDNFPNLMASFKGKRRENLMSSRNFFNNLVRRYGPQGATEIIRNHPAFSTNRQRSLAEVLPAYQTENPFNEDGSIKPGAVPPVTAVKQMSASDIERLMLGAGLMPIGSQTDSDNQGYERNIVIPSIMDQFAFEQSDHSKAKSKLRKPMIIGDIDRKNRGGTQAGSFVSPTTVPDIRAAIVASKREPHKLRMLGIRGLNPIDDFVQQRASTGQREGTSEGYVHSRIDPSRLVPIEIPKGSIPATVRGDVSINMNDPTPSQDQRVANLLGTINDGFKPGITQDTLTPRMSKRGFHKDLNLETLFNFHKDGFHDSKNSITQQIERNTNRMKGLDESLKVYQNRLKELKDMTSFFETLAPHDLDRHNASIEHVEYRIDDIEGEKEQIKTQTQHLNHRLLYHNQDFQEASKQYANALRSLDTQLPFLTDIPQTGINLDEELPKLESSLDGHDGGTQLDDRNKLNFNLDKHGFPLNEDGTAMTLDEKINLVTDPNLQELAENIFKNRKRVISQIRSYNTKLPFGDDTPTKEKIKPNELENYLENLERARDYEIESRGKTTNQELYQNYIDKLRREHADARKNIR